jgi:hypothetical protein
MNKSNMQTYTQYPAMIVPLVRCTELPMFEGHLLAVTAQLEASQVELTVLHRNRHSSISQKLDRDSMHVWLGARIPCC